MGLTAVLPFGITAARGDWRDLFDGQSMNGWRPSEHKSSWRAVDGALTADGPRSHLFYTGPVSHADFRNFELEVELATQPNCNSGVYFHTAHQETGFPEKGLEVQISNTAHYISTADRTGGRYCLYRWHADNPITFRKRLKHTMEHGHANDRAYCFYSTACWHQAEPFTDFPTLPGVSERIPAMKL